MNFISNIISNSVAGFVDAGTRAAGGFAGDTLIKAGDLIENTGRGVGTTVEGAATSYGVKIAGKPPVNTGKAGAPKKTITAGKPAGVQRSHSSPASTVAKKSATPMGANKYPGGKTSGVPLGANKYPGGNKPVSKVSSAKPAATKKPALAGAPKPSPSVSSKPDTSNPKPYPGTTTYPSKSKPSGGAPGAKGAAKPYPGTSTTPGSGKKTAVTAGKPKPMSTSYAPPSKAGSQFGGHLPEFKV